MKPIVKTLCIGLPLCLGLFWVFQASAQPSQLAKIHDDIVSEYQHVSHITSQRLSQFDQADILLFDVREPGEFTVSHLEGAVQIDPDISEAEFKARYAEALAGKRAVFYCSVGRRSSIVAERVASVVKTQTEHTPINLAAGIFGWSNESRAMVSGDGQRTEFVHPYNAYWGRLIENPEIIRYKAEP